MSESLSVDEGWEEPLDSDQVTHVRGEIAAGLAATGEWLVNVSEQVIVPMTTTDVVEALRSRRITDRSLVWRSGMQDWTSLGDVPPLRLAAGSLATPQRVAAAVPAPRARVATPAPERVLHPPPKEPARAARDERVRRNTLPFGFPVVRDPATIREPAGLHAAPIAPVAAPPRPASEEVEALAIYERATPSLTFSDSVRAEWQGTTNLVSQAAAPGPPAPPPVMARPAPRSRPEPKIEPKPRLSLEPQSDPKPRLSLEPQSDPKPRLSLEPQSDPMQSRWAAPERKVSGAGSQPPSSLAPTTSEPENGLPARGAGLWGDLSVVLASDMRAVQATSKRVTLMASLGSAALASLLTFWFAHSSTRPAPEPAVAAQPAPVAAALKAEAVPVPSVVVSPAALPTPSAVPASAHAGTAPSSAVAAVHAVIKPAAAPAIVARPKQAPRPAPEPDATSVAADLNPYADPLEHIQPKAPTAAFKETSAPAPSSESTTTPKAPNVPSGLEDSASPVHPAPTAAPGF